IGWAGRGGSALEYPPRRASGLLDSTASTSCEPGRTGVPRKKLSMRKTTEVLRLHAEGLSQRQIAVGAGVGKTTVLEYLARAKEAGISWPLPDGMDGEVLDAALFPA